MPELDLDAMKARWDLSRKGIHRDPYSDVATLIAEVEELRTLLTNVRRTGAGLSDREKGHAIEAEQDVDVHDLASWTRGVLPGSELRVLGGETLVWLSVTEGHVDASVALDLDRVAELHRCLTDILTRAGRL